MREGKKKTKLMEALRKKSPLVPLHPQNPSSSFKLWGDTPRSLPELPHGFWSMKPRNIECEGLATHLKRSNLGRSSMVFVVLRLGLLQLKPVKTSQKSETNHDNGKKLHPSFHHLFIICQYNFWIHVENCASNCLAKFSSLSDWWLFDVNHLSCWIDKGYRGQSPRRPNGKGG